MIRIPQFELVPTPVRLELQREYAELLLQHEPLRRELDALYEQREKYPFLTMPPLEDWDAIMLHFIREDYFAFLVNEGLPEEAEAQLLERDSVDWRLYQFYKQMYAFCSKWKLPHDIWECLFHIVFTARDCEEVRWWRENCPLPTGAGYTIPQGLPEPPQIPHYSPLHDTRESYLARVQQIAAEYIEQVEGVWRAAGWRGEQAFSHYRNPQYLRRLAKQVFMRVVLGMGWGAIRAALASEGTIVESRSTIQRSTERAIEILQIREWWGAYSYRVPSRKIDDLNTVRRKISSVLTRLPEPPPSAEAGMSILSTDRQISAGVRFDGEGESPSFKRIP